MSSQLQNASSNVSFGRAVIVCTLAIWMLSVALPGVVRVWSPLGSFGYSTNASGHVTAVSRGSPADVAGMRVDDDIDLGAVRYDYRRYAVGPLTLAPSPGTQVELFLKTSGSSRRIGMTSVAESLSPGDKFILILRSLGALVFVVVGATLVLMRPSVLTWGLYLYMIGLNPGSDAVVDAVLPPSAYIVNWSLEFAAIAAGYVGFLAFALRFPHEAVTGWRHVASRATPWVAVVVLGLSTFSTVAPFVFAVPSAPATIVFFAIVSAIFVTGFVALMATYNNVRGLDRQRIKWVIVGFAIGVPGFVLAALFDIASWVPFQVPYWLTGSLLCLNLFVPITIAYAVIHHHVIDISFVISRAVVYAALTAVLVAVFALIDFEIGQRLGKLEVPVQVVVSIGFAFWFNAIIHRINDIVDGILFKRRHEAEKQLARIARALPHAQSPETVDRMLVDEPAEALDLASAALFRTNDDGRAVLARHRGWPETSPSALDADDSLVLQLTADQTPLDLREMRWHRPDLPTATARPLLALPVTVRRRLAAFVLYSGHVGGEALDPTEQRFVNALAVGAAAAYDHLDAEHMRRRVAELEAALAQTNPAT